MATEKSDASADKDEPVINEDTGEPEFEAKEVVLDGDKAVEPSPDEPVDPGVALLRSQLEASESERRRAEQERDAERNARAQAERQTGAISVSMVDQAMEAGKSYRSQLRQQFIAAQTAGNYESAADIQIAISQNEANLLALQQQKQYVEQQAAQPQQRPAPQRAEPTLDGPSQIAQQMERTGYPKSADWIRAHRDQVANSDGVERVNAAHEYAVKIKGLRPETPEYFARIEEELGLSEPPVRVVPPAAPRPRTAAAAPASSSAPSLNGQSRHTRITLNPKQVEHADILGMSPEEYAIAMNDPKVQTRLLGNKR